jgi:ABC-type Fe3+-hydroxamate transport system substrate-binding protein
VAVLVDDLGEVVPLRGAPSRVVSLVPSVTEAVAHSAPQLLIGATDYCVHPASLDVTRVGGSKYPDVGKVLALAPDLVLANEEENRPEDVNVLRANGIPVWVSAAPSGVLAALGALHRICTVALGLPEPDWLWRATGTWLLADPTRATAIVPVWRKPWVVVGRDTFAGDVLHRIGIANAFADHAERYPRPALAELTGLLERGAADLVVLPDEPYPFSERDGPEAFPGARCVLVSGRDLTWWGPSLLTARDTLTAAFAALR